MITPSVLWYSTYGYFIIMIQKNHFFYQTIRWGIVKQLLIRDLLSRPTPFDVMTWISNNSIICSHCCNMGCEYISTYLIHLYSRLAEEYPGIGNIGIGSQNTYRNHGSMIGICRAMLQRESMVTAPIIRICTSIDFCFIVHVTALNVITINSFSCNYVFWQLWRHWKPPSRLMGKGYILIFFLFHLRFPTRQIDKFSMNSISVLINWI